MSSRPEKNSKTKKIHPPIPEMVDKVMYSFGRKGCSLNIIKKMITEQYSLDMKYYNHNIKMYIKKSFQNGHYIQKSGVGLSGKFILIKNGKTSKPKTKRRNKMLMEAEAFDKF